VCVLARTDRYRKARASTHATGLYLELAGKAVVLHWNVDMTSSTKRRWFQFSLRSIIIVVTLLGFTFGWIAYQLSWIRQRQEIIASPKFSYGTGEYGFGPTPIAPWHLRIFDETGYTGVSLIIVDEERVRFGSEVFIDLHDTRLTLDERREIERIEQLFPEANARALIRWWP